MFKRFFQPKPPDRLLEISERVYVFDCCFSTDGLEEDEYRVYLDGITSQLQEYFPRASFMVFNFREGDSRSLISDVLSQYDMTVMDYPREYESCPLLPLEMIHHFLRSIESWLSLEGQQNVVLMHCERGGWPVLAFMLAGLLLYRKIHTGEQKTLDMVYKQAPKELLHLLAPLNPQPSQLRYLQYISRRDQGADWPPSDRSVLLDCLILRNIPLFDDGKGCRPFIRVYGQDPSKPADKSSKLLFSNSKTKNSTRHYVQAECILVKMDICCHVQGDVVVECIHLYEDLVREEMLFRVMFHTAFVRSNIMMLSREDIDILWDAKEQFSKEFRSEVLFSDSVLPNLTTVGESDDGNGTGRDKYVEEYVEEWNEAVSKAFGDHNDELKKAARELNASQLVHTKEERDTYKRIKLSYQTLSFDDAKSLFLLCSMFPDDYDIPIEELLKYGIGKGLFQYSDTLQNARDRGNSMIAFLKASGLLLDGKKGCVRMHCDIRNVAMSIALSEEGHAFFVKAGCELKDWPMDAHEGYSAISLMKNKLNQLPETSVCSELQILLLQSNAGISDIPETFFRSPNALRVFDLSSTGISVLPSSFNFLTNLQALYLDCCNKITDISVVGKLKKVEILSLRKFPHKELPKEIGNLTSLRFLDVTGGYLHKIPSRVISRLYRLEELYLKCEFGDWGSEVKEAVGETNADFDEIISLSRLNILKVYISDAACLPEDIGYFELHWVKFDICISRSFSSELMISSNDQPSRTLTLDRTINGLSDWFINTVTKEAERLEYRECKGLNNIVEEYEHGRLHGLKHLSVLGCHENLEGLINATAWDSSKPVFESLEELHLLHLQRLKELCVGELPLGSLCKLKLLKVQTCRNLVNALLPLKLLQRLTDLETIFCVNMEHMKYVFGSEGLEHGMILVTKLSEMRFCALFELISIWDGPAPHAVFHNLKVLAVCECTKLKTLFPFDVARSLVQLEDLSIERCPNLNRVIEAHNSFDRNIIFPQLKKLALINLSELTWFCTENGYIGIECPLLEYLYVEKCPQFINTASASVKLKDQQHFNSLAKRWEDMYTR